MYPWWISDDEIKNAKIVEETDNVSVAMRSKNPEVVNVNAAY